MTAAVRHVCFRSRALDSAGGSIYVNLSRLIPSLGKRVYYLVPSVKRTPMVLEIGPRDLTNRVRTSFTLVGNEADLVGRSDVRSGPGG